MLNFVNFFELEFSVSNMHKEGFNKMNMLKSTVNYWKIFGSKYRISLLLILLFQMSKIQCDINTMEEFLENMLSETVYDKRVRPYYISEYGKKFFFNKIIFLKY